LLLRATPALLFLPLFTGVRGIGILRTSPFGDSAKFVYTEFSEVRTHGVLRSSHSPVPIAHRRAGCEKAVAAHTNYKQMFVAREHPPSRISIHRCYKRYRAGATRGVWSG
jgi:hypothetical protein